MHCHSSFTLAISCFAVFCLVGIQACPAWSPTEWFSSSGDTSQVGTPAWWKKHKSKAEFVPGEGFRVEGFAGFFDDQGRPIQTSVAKVVEQKKAKGLLNDIKVVEQVDGIKRNSGSAQMYQARSCMPRGKICSAARNTTMPPMHSPKRSSAGPDSQIEQDAMFFQAESYFFGKKYARRFRCTTNCWTNIPTRCISTKSSGGSSPSPAIGSSTTTTIPIGSRPPIRSMTRVPGSIPWAMRSRPTRISA